MRLITQSSTYYGDGATAHPITGAVFASGDALYEQENSGATFEVSEGNIFLLATTR